jgi:hypothetical protein
MHLKTFTNNMKNKNYRQIICEGIYEFIRNKYDDIFERVVLQDNSPIHQSEKCTRLLDKLNISWVNFFSK